MEKEFISFLIKYRNQIFKRPRIYFTLPIIIFVFILFFAFAFLAESLWNKAVNIWGGVVDNWIISILHWVKDNPQSYMWLIAGLLAIVLFCLLLWVFIDTIKNENKKGSNSSNSERTIQAMVSSLKNLDDRLTNLAKNAITRNISSQEIEDISKYISNAIDVVTDVEMETLINNLKQRPDVKRMRKSKLIKLVRSKLPTTQERKFNVDDMIKVGKVLDGKKKGLAQLRNQDKDWNRLYNELRGLQNNIADAKLDGLISNAIYMSYGFNSVFLYVEYLKKHIENEYFPPIFIKLGAAIDVIDKNVEIDKQITKVVNRMRELLLGDSKREQGILETLANFIPEGENIREQCYSQKEKVPEHEAKEWAEKVALSLDELGSHYRPTFYNSDGLGTAKIPPMYSREHQRIALFVSYRLMRIQQFLGEFRQK